MRDVHQFFKSELFLLKSRTNEKQEESRKRSFKFIFWMFIAKIAFIALCAIGGIWLIFFMTHSGTGSKNEVTFHQVLGGGYASHGSHFWLASTHGIVSYNESRWKNESVKPIPRQTRFLSVENGWIRMERHSVQAAEISANGKRTDTIHLPQNASGIWAADYHTHELYHLAVSGGVYSIEWSTENGKSWHHRSLHGIHGKVQRLAVNPGNSRIFAIATTQGLYLSSDGGSTFQTYFRGKEVTSIAYSFSSQPSLLAAYFDKKQKETFLYHVIPDQRKAINLDLDTVANDRVTQILTSPVHPQESVVLTAGDDGYQTKNGGQNWTIIAQRGRGLQTK